MSENINNNELYIEWHTNDKLVEYISGYVINIVEYEPTLESNKPVNYLPSPLPNEEFIIPITIDKKSHKKITLYRFRNFVIY